MKICTKCHFIQDENAKFCDQCGIMLTDEKITYTEEEISAELEIKSNTLMRYNGKREHVVIPSIFNRIGVNAFAGNENLKSVIIPEGITEIMSGAFAGCAELRDVKLPSTLTMIGAGAFQNCTTLKYIDLPEGLTNINPYAFYGCNSVTELEIPVNVRRIGSCAFGGCIALENVYFNADLVKKTGERGEIFKDSGLINGIKVVIGKNVRESPAFLFATENNYWGKREIINVVSVEFEQGGKCTVIREGAFQNCTKLTEINLPNGLIEIQDFAFHNCPLKEVKLPESVTRVSDIAFK